MGWQTEYWANVYSYAGKHEALDVQHPSRERADRKALCGRVGRIHVRLKPEGAPARYADAEHRRKWEAHPGIMQMHDPLFSLANLPRTLKTEESAS